MTYNSLKTSVDKDHLPNFFTDTSFDRHIICKYLQNKAILDHMQA